MINFNNFDCISPLCNCGKANEDNEHYLLHYLRFNQTRKGLFDTVAEVLGSDIANLDSVTLFNMLLYGSYNLTLVQNRMIIEAPIDYNQKTNRLTWSNQGNLRDSLLQLRSSCFFPPLVSRVFVLFPSLFLLCSVNE